MTAGPTPSQTIGPFFSIGTAWLTAHPDQASGSTLSGRVLDGDGAAVPDAMVEIWVPPHFFRALTGDDGRYELAVTKPAVPSGQAPHVLMSVFARGLLQRLVTRVYFPDESEANASDPVLLTVPAERRPTLIAAEADGCLRFDVHLQGPAETVFFAY